MTDTPDSPRPASPANDSDDAALGDLAQRVYAERRRRAEIAGTTGLFGEPAWDLLLHLFVAARDNRRVSVAEACAASETPESPARRWIAILETRGLVALDGEAIKLSLSGYAALAAYFRKG